jgi:glutathione S-transferase
MQMDLYFSPLACSMGTRIACYETGADTRFIEVDPKTKRTRDGADYRAINPLGLVPAIRTDDGEVMTENAAILQYVADRFPNAELAPAAGMGRSRLQQWLCFIGTELHKALFVPLLDPKAPDAGKAYARDQGASRLAYLDRYLAGRDYLLDRFSVADAYLFTVLNWSTATAIDLAHWPAVKDYYSRMRRRPSIAKALAEERALYAEQQARHKAA